MKKTFPLDIPGKKGPRVVEAIKHELRKYVKRERRKSLPEGMDFWDFDCRIGTSKEDAKSTHVKIINPSIDEIVETNPSSLYVEILARAEKRRPKNSTNPSLPKPSAPSSKE